MLRVLIIDDESAGIKVLRLMIEKYDHVLRIVGSTTVAAEGIKLIEDYKPEVVFLDISMPEMSGFELLEKLKFKDFKLVFTTAHKEYAIQAIKNKAYDYLLKPIDEDDFKKFVSNLIDEKEEKQLNKQAPASIAGLLKIQVRDGIIFMKQKDIIRLEASGSYTTIYLEAKGKQLVSKGIKELEVMLDPNIFYRCHNSHIINLDKVEKFINNNGFFVLMNDKSKIEVSRRNKEVFLQKFNNS